MGIIVSMSIFKRPSIGIDLGTSNVLTFVPRKGIVMNEPPLIAVSKDDEIIAMGSDAKEISGRVLDNVTIVKPLKSGVIADYKYCEILLRYFLKKSLGSLFLIKPNVIVSVPGNVSSKERRIIIDTVKKAGALNVYLEREPMLAALGSDISISSPKGILVLDIGGGTSDTAVISLGGVVSAKSINHGGIAIDNAIVRYMSYRHGIRISEKIAEAVKKKALSAVSVQENVNVEIKGKDIKTNLPNHKKIQINEFVPIIQKELDKILQIVKDIFHEIPPELASDVIERGIILTGGSAKLKGLPEFIKLRMGIEAIIPANPEESVIRGLSILLKKLDRYNKILLTKK